MINTKNYFNIDTTSFSFENFSTQSTNTSITCKCNKTCKRRKSTRLKQSYQFFSNR
ncbi:Uncharacterised protein [Segatella copri]|nr:Uncharacterised protein [Segatella copri]